MSEIPAPPPGFQLMDMPPPTMRITVRPSTPQPPAGFEMVQGGTPAPPQSGQGAALVAPPGYQTAHDLTNALGQGLTFGFGDEIMGGALTPIELGIGTFNGEDANKGIGDRISDAYSRAVGKVRGELKAGQERSPIASGVGEGLGSVVTAGGLAKQGVTLLGAGARASYPSMIARGAAEGAGYGALHGLGSGEGIEDRLGRAAKGGGVGAAFGGILGGIGARIASKISARTAPTIDELRNASNIAYDMAKNANVVISPVPYRDMVAKMFMRLADEGVDPTLHPGVMSAFQRMRELADLPEGIAFKSLDIMRRVANSAGKSIANRDEGRLARIMVDEIDDLMLKLKPQDVLMGDASTAMEMIQAGRALWSRVRNAETIENLIERAKDRLGANYTAAGFQTAIRQEIKSLLRNKSDIKFFSKEAQNMLRSVVRGASFENFMRQIGKFAPRGIVSATLGGGAGYALGGPVGAAAVMGAGEIAKRASAAMTNTKVQNVLEFVRRGGQRAIEQLSPRNRAILNAAVVSGSITADEIGQ